MKSNLWYVVSTSDALELPLYYALRCDEVANWIGCSPYSIFTAFARAKKVGKSVVKVCGFTVERVALGE